MRSSPCARPRISLLVTLALATVGASASCHRTSAPAPDAAGGRPADSGQTADGSRPGADSAVDTAIARPDSAADAPADLLALDAGGPDVAGDAGGGNPARLWFSGPESDLHLADLEPMTPF